MGNIYSLIASVGLYDEESIATLSTYNNDIGVFCDALINGLYVDKDNIRVLGEEGYVSAKALGLAMSAFAKMMNEEDSFIFYFSGHGNKGQIALSDGSINVQGLISFIDGFRAKNKIIIMDSCHSGDYKLIDEESAYKGDLFQNHIGEGMVIVASSSAMEVSRTNETLDSSIFTYILSTAIKSNASIKNGKKSFTDIINQTRTLMNFWNAKSPGNAQNPVIRDYIIGSIFFDVPVRKYVSNNISYENDEYYLESVKSLSTNQIKRLAAFIIPKKNIEPEKLEDITKNVVNTISTEKIYSSKLHEEIFKDSGADAIWCYFGKDESDLIKSNYYAYTIWSKEEYKGKYYRENSNMKIIGDICVFINDSYQLIKKLNETNIPKEEYENEANIMLDKVLRKAESLIREINEYRNARRPLCELYDNYKDWINEVNDDYNKLTSFESAPDVIYDWFGTILSIAGDVIDLSLLINKKNFKEVDDWLINQKIGEYQKDLDILRDFKCNY